MAQEKPVPLPLFHRTMGQGPPLVLLHGLGSSGEDWAFQVGPLAREFHLVVPDLRGSGRSPAPPGPYSVAIFAADVWHLLDGLGHARVHLMGFSLGGAVALEMALQRPDAVDRLMTINSLPTYRADSWRKRYAVHAQLSMLRLFGPARFAPKIARRLFPAPHQEPLRSRVLQVVGAAPKRPYLDSAQALARWCALARVDSLRARTLVVAAEHDYTPYAEKRAYAERLGAQFVLVRGSRHGTPFDAIEACNACALAFFRDQALPPPEQLVIDSPERMPTAPPDDFFAADARALP